MSHDVENITIDAAHRRHICTSLTVRAEGRKEIMVPVTSWVIRMGETQNLLRTVHITNKGVGLRRSPLSFMCCEQIAVYHFYEETS